MWNHGRISRKRKNWALFDLSRFFCLFLGSAPPPSPSFFSVRHPIPILWKQKEKVVVWKNSMEMGPCLITVMEYWCVLVVCFIVKSSSQIYFFCGLVGCSLFRQNFFFSPIVTINHETKISHWLDKEIKNRKYINDGRPDNIVIVLSHFLCGSNVSRTKSWRLGLKVDNIILLWKQWKCWLFGLTYFCKIRCSIPLGLTKWLHDLYYLLFNFKIGCLFWPRFLKHF